MGLSWSHCIISTFAKAVPARHARAFCLALFASCAARKDKRRLRKTRRLEQQPPVQNVVPTFGTSVFSTYGCCCRFASHMYNVLCLSPVAATQPPRGHQGGDQEEPGQVAQPTRQRDQDPQGTCWSAFSPRNESMDGSTSRVNPFFHGKRLIRRAEAGKNIPLQARIRF